LLGDEPEMELPTCVPGLGLNFGPVAHPKVWKRGVHQVGSTPIDWTYSAGILLHSASIPEFGGTLHPVIRDLVSIYCYFSSRKVYEEISKFLFYEENLPSSMQSCQRANMGSLVTSNGDHLDTSLFRIIGRA
jgi:hypothetical protein